MKKIKYIIYTLLVGFIMTSCNSFLDIVPDERPQEDDAFEDVNAAERFLYSCYAYLPSPNSGSGSLDFMTGDEVVTAFEHEPFASFPKGNFTAASPVISYWNTFFQGIRQCYILLNNIHKTPQLPDATRKDYEAQAKFLIAYYHYLLARCYGPIILIKEEPSIVTPASDYLPRSSYEESVTFICDLFDEAFEDLPAERPVRSYGLATSVAAKALKAKMLVYAASPLYNGNSKFYNDFKDKDGNPLMPIQYDPNKWVLAKNALKEAIDHAHAEGYELYTRTDLDQGNKEPLDPIQHRLRYNIMDKGNKEIIWADSRGEGLYGIQNKSAPFISGSAWNGVAPTMAMLKRFYTENGLPIDVDPNYDAETMFNLVTVGSEHADVAEEGQRTLKFNLNREPRFYSWIAFQGGFYEILSATVNGGYAKDESYKKYSKTGQGKLVCDFVLGGNCARGTVGNIRSNNYSPTGYLNKKGVDPANEMANNLKGPLAYPWPLIRLADLYLSYAEACVETNDLALAKEYTNKIRERAGIPTVEESWEVIAGRTLNQKTMRDIVRQERMIEFYLENQNFWDMRRWLLAEENFDKKAEGMNIEASTIDGFSKITEVVFERKFDGPTQYLLPIPLADVNRNENVIQNPGY